MRFTVFVLLVALCGWWLGNVVELWAQTRILQGRLRRQLEQQQQLRRIFEGEFEDITPVAGCTPQPVRCICEWFDHDSLIRNPACKATDHGGIQAMLDRVKQQLPSRYKFRKD